MRLNLRRHDGDDKAARGCEVSIALGRDVMNAVMKLPGPSTRHRVCKRYQENVLAALFAKDEGTSANTGLKRWHDADNGHDRQVSIAIVCGCIVWQMTIEALIVVTAAALLADKMSRPGMRKI